MRIAAEQVLKKANQLVSRYNTRNPERLAAFLGITIMPRQFRYQKGVYTVIARNRYIFLKEDLPPIMRNIVLLHEIGHDVLHRNEAIQSGGFQELNIFDMRDCRMEYEANLFAAEIALPDEDILECIEKGYDAAQIAHEMQSDINLVALKAADLNRRGYRFQDVEHRNNFLK